MLMFLERCSQHYFTDFSFVDFLILIFDWHELELMVLFFEEVDFNLATKIYLHWLTLLTD